jgi:hypothetical protein
MGRGVMATIIWNACTVLLDCSEKAALTVINSAVQSMCRAQEN